MLEVDQQLLAHVRQEICDEHVARAGHAVENVAAFRLGNVQSDAALAAVHALDHGIAVRIEHDIVPADEAALRIAIDRMLDLDHVGAPIGHQRA